MNIDNLQNFNTELKRLLDKYDAEFAVDYGYDSDIRGIDVQLPEGWITYAGSGTRLCSHDLNNPSFIVENT